MKAKDHDQRQTGFVVRACDLPVTMAMNALRTTAMVLLFCSCIGAGVLINAPNSSTDDERRRSSLDTGGGILWRAVKNFWLRFAIDECGRTCSIGARTFSD